MSVQVAVAKMRVREAEDPLSSVFFAAHAMVGVTRIKRKLTAKLGSKKVTISDDHLRRLMAKATGSAKAVELDRPALVKLCSRINLQDAEGQAQNVFDTIDKNGDGSIDLSELFASLSMFPHIAKAIHLWSDENTRARKERVGAVRMKRATLGGESASNNHEGDKLSGIERHVSATIDGHTVSISDFELEQLIAVVDDDNSGTLDIEEVVEMFQHIELDNARRTAEDIFKLMDASGDGAIEVGELFETLVSFPQVIRAISDANLLFDAESDKESGGSGSGSGSGSSSDSGSDSNSLSPSASPRSPRLADPAVQDEGDEEQPSGREEGGGGGGGGGGRGGYGRLRINNNLLDGAKSFFAAQGRISPPPRLSQFTREEKLQELESKMVGMRVRPVSRLRARVRAARVRAQVWALARARARACVRACTRTRARCGRVCANAVAPTYPSICPHHVPLFLADHHHRPSARTQNTAQHRSLARSLARSPLRARGTPPPRSCAAKRTWTRR